MRRALVRENPEHVWYRSDLGLTLGNAAVVLTNLGKKEDALATIRESVEQHRAAVERSPKTPHYRRFLASACALHMQLALDTGHPDEALAAARERQKAWAGNPAELYALAADLARMAKTWPAGAVVLKAHPADLAVTVLREAIAAGFRDGAKLRNDPAFAALRERTDFTEMVAGLTAGDGSR